MAILYRSVYAPKGISLDSIQITTPPTKTSYYQNETIDRTGMVVTATADLMTGNVASSCSLTPDTATTIGTEEIVVGYRGKTDSFNISVQANPLTITSMPTKTSYVQGEALDLTGLVVTHDNDGDVTSQCTFSPDDGDTLSVVGAQRITVTYNRVSTSFSISVAEETISITTPPTRTTYVQGETLNLTGIVVMTNSGRDVTSECTFSPANGTTLSTLGSFTLTATYHGKSDSISYQVVAVGTLDNTDWSVIKAVGAAGIGSQYWSVGDTKTIRLNGTVGTVSFNNYTTKVFIVHFNYRNSNGVYFQGFKDSSTGKDIALVDANHGKGSTNGTKYFNINHWGAKTFGGWKGCDLRYDILGSTDVEPSSYGAIVADGRIGYDATSTCATNPVSNTLMSALPSDLREVIAPWTIYTDNVGNASASSSNVTASIDYLPLISEYELMGTRTYANEYEQNYQSYLTYYANGANIMKYQYTNLNTSAMQSTRSQRSSSNNTFSIAQTNISSAVASGSFGLAPAFRVA